MDHGTEECADGIFLPSNVACLGRLYRSDDSAAMAVLRCRHLFLFARVIGQNDGLYVACRFVLSLVA